MSIDQPGLEKRVGREARRISSQHRQLDELYGLIARALQDNAPEPARASFVRFCDALEAHFSLEDGFYFPAVHGMRPELGAELDQLSSAHESFRRQIQELSPLFEAGELARCEPLFDQLIIELARHEGQEEELLARIRGEAPPE